MTKKLNIRLSYDFDLESFATLFPEIQLYNQNDKTPIDLLVFPGGEDVELEQYLGKDDAARYNPLCNTNPGRDKVETSIFVRILSGEIKVNKVLGICRGAQFLNVMFGGTLFPDLPSYNIHHDRVHDVTHIMPSEFSFIEYVNSLHHQGLRSIGKTNRVTGQRVGANILAVDKGGYVTEIVSWMNDRFIGMQFHPEYYLETNPDKIKLKELFYAWVSENKALS